MRTNISRAARLRASRRHSTPTPAPMTTTAAVTGAVPSAVTGDAAEPAPVSAATPTIPAAIPAAGRRPRRGRVSPLQSLARVTLGSVLVFAGIGHLTFAREEFQAQVPRTLGLDPDAVVVGSGWVEIALGTAILARGGRRPGMGRFTAGFFAAVFPGNLAQFVGRRDGFGLDTDNKRAARLLGQPLLMAWALWSMGAIGKRRA